MADLITARQAAQRLGLSPRKIYELAATGRLPSFRFDDAIRFDPQDLETYRESCRSTTTRSSSAGATNSAVSLMDSDEELQNYFRRRGLLKKQKPTAKPKTRANTHLQLAHSESSP